jgi:hypothetical protein
MFSIMPVPAAEAAEAAEVAEAMRCAVLPSHLPKVPMNRLKASKNSLLKKRMMRY